jgi:hypothetical protein
MAFAAARMILKDKRRKSKEDFVPPRQRSKVDDKHMKRFFVSFDIIASIVFHGTHVQTFPFVFFTFDDDVFDNDV